MLSGITLSEDTMIHHYDITYNNVPVFYNVRAISEKDAIDQAYRFDPKASASAYSGRAKHNYKAIKK